ncbi:MAG: hypothetical protein ABIX12_12795 [Rubrivivax sp.]
MSSESARTEREWAAALAIVRDVYVGRGKIEVLPKFRARSMDDIALYTPGFGYLVKEILERPDALGELTWRDNAVAVVSVGTVVLGPDIGVVGLAGVIARGIGYDTPHRTWIAEHTNPTGCRAGLAQHAGHAG